MFLDESAVSRYITETFADVSVASDRGNHFFFYSPDDSEENKFPFATLVTDDSYDQVSDLERPGVYRLNTGIGKETFRSLFGRQRSSSGGESKGGGYDFTELDKVMPHPIYGLQYWVCILSPSAATFRDVVQPLLAEAYNEDVERRNRRAGRC